MKKIISYSLFCLICLTSCQKCKKSATPDKVTISGTIYTDCYNVSKNTTYYRVYLSYLNTPAEEFTTDANGVFSFDVDKSKAKAHFMISIDSNPNHTFAAFYGTGENLNISSIREEESNLLIVKLKTNHLLTNLDTLKYAFQYSNMELPIHGPISKDTIIGTYIKKIDSPNSSSSSGEVKTLWWSLNKATVGSYDNQVDYTIHGCASVADTAYIVVP